MEPEAVPYQESTPVRPISLPVEERISRAKNAYDEGRISDTSYRNILKQLGAGKLCLSCNQIIGEKRLCPRCGARQHGRFSERKCIALACILLLIGFGYVGAASVFADTPVTKVGDMTESDNFRHMRVIGRVMDTPDFYQEAYESTGTLRLLLDDDTGDIWVRVVPSVTAVLMSSGAIPGFGDVVDCEGALFVGEGGYLQIKVRDAKMLNIVEQTPRSISVYDLFHSPRTEFELGDKVVVEGKIEGRFYVEGFAWILDLGDGQGHAVSVFIPDTISLLTGEIDVDALYLSKVRVTGGVQWYERDSIWEIIPAGSGDLELLEPYQGDTYTALSVAQLLVNASAYQYQFVQLENVTVNWAYADYLFSVGDTANAALEISIFVDYGANASTGIKVGQKFSVRGWVDFYDSNKNGTPDPDEWEIKVRALSSDYALRQGG